MDSRNAKPGSMKLAIEKILTAHQQITAFHEHEHYSVKIESNGFMPLIIEKHGEQIVVAHYFEQAGDLLDTPRFLRTTDDRFFSMIEKTSRLFFCPS